MKFKLALCLCIIGFYNIGLSATFTVKKVKGRQAIIETQTPLEEGMSYEISTDDISLDTPSSKSPPRYNSLQLGASLQSLSGSSVQDNRMEISARYGWNFESFEAGPTLRYQSIDLGAGADSFVFVGAFADYNGVKNKAPNNMIWGFTGDFDLGSMQFKAGGSAAVVNLNAGGFGTWFFAKSNAALRLQGLYGIQKISTTSSESTLSGFFSKAFLVFYF